MEIQKNRNTEAMKNTEDTTREREMRPGLWWEMILEILGMDNVYFDDKAILGVK